jgi:hypothetical protein
MILVWGGLAAGFGLVLYCIPKPGFSSAPAPLPAEGALPLPAGGGEEQFAFALSALGEGRLEEAAHRFDLAIALDPAFASAYVHKAYALARMEGTPPDVLRGLLAEALRRGFDCGAALANEAKVIERGGVGDGVGRFHLERAVLLGFGEPADPAAAREALAAARAAGFAFPEGLARVLDESQVVPPPGR